ncbi:hypothetical protein CDL12_04584 [Handroanthus impetiginosus]|uniref:Uncharacterized protein n=1 Tax=Handroanthus impetiginosus TaxID=429701 RepID=A0A2G9HYV8_9LAMI|nr:hypothetical protein CDL12_04584 [Handroanthus impetiginosus]
MDALLPPEIEVQTHRVMTFNPDRNEELCRQSLDLLEERRHMAELRNQKYKRRICLAFDQKVKARAFHEGEWVLRRADVLKGLGKLDQAWEGPFRVVGILPGGAYQLANTQGEVLKRPWNIQHLKRFYA